MWPSFLAKVKKAPPLCCVSTPSSPSLPFSLSLSLSLQVLPWLICRKLTGVIKRGAKVLTHWDQETSRCASICWELTAINFSESLSKAAAVKRSARWSVVALSASQGGMKWWRQPRGSLQPAGQPASKVSHWTLCPLAPLHIAPWQKCQNKMEQLETHETHSWKLRGKKENSFAKENKNNNNLIFIIITIMTAVVVTTGHLILSSAPWMWSYISISKWKSFMGRCFVANGIHRI